MIALVIAPLFTGCEPQSKPAESSGTKRLHLAFVANSPGEYWATVNLGCSIAAQQLGEVDVDFRYPSAATVEEQQRIVTDLLAAGVDGIAISPIDAEKQTEFLNSVATKTMLVCADSDAAKSKRATYIGTDNIAAGAQAADLIKAALPDGGKIALFVGHAGAQNTQARVQGLKRGLGGSNIQIVEIFEDGQKSTVAGENVTKAKTKYADLAGVVGLSGYHGPALLTALRTNGLAGKVKIVCFDDNSDTLNGIVAGDIYGTIAQKPFQVGKQTVVHMHSYLRSDRSKAPEAQIFTPARALTQENVGHHIAQQNNISAFLKESPTLR
jgi:ribose transport system substrate-binding protein